MKIKSVNMTIKQQEVVTVKLEDRKGLIRIHLMSLMIIFLKINPELIMKHTLKDHPKREREKILYATYNLTLFLQ